MEDTPKNYEEGGEGNTRALGTEALANMPNFGGHTKSPEDTRREGELLEGARDEQDYRKFVAEMEAREAEKTEKDREILEGIRNIMNPDARSLLTAEASRFFTEDNDEMRERRQSILPIMLEWANSSENGEKDSPLSIFLLKRVRDLATKEENESDEAEASKFRKTNSLILVDFKQTCEIEEGQAVEKEDIEEGILVGPWFIHGLDTAPRDKEYYGELKAVRKIAKDLGKTLDARVDSDYADDYEHEKTKNMLNALASGSYRRNFSKGLDGDLISAVEFLRRTQSPRFREEGFRNVEVAGSEILPILSLSELKKKLNSVCSNHAKYKEELKKGQAILESKLSV